MSKEWINIFVYSLFCFILLVCNSNVCLFVSAYLHNERLNIKLANI